MTIFYGIVHKDEDSAYGVTFPDLPGCFSAADEDGSIIPNASEALELWFEDQEMVRPSSITQIGAKALDDLAAGAFIVAVPYIRSATRSQRINVSMDAGLVEAIDEAAGQRKITRSAFLAQAAKREIVGAI